ncbi:DUF4199 domain-containing protein [Rufibacter roseolus]|uniref:DUF4199 domain-containing protein n=1 Tax=Rufibacter roseolus TaxID=2817375 RepID=UPI001B3171F9|nr:DUF4199 domain-containing protein [Rufibacter roseolus]
MNEQAIMQESTVTPTSVGVRYGLIIGLVYVFFQVITYITYTSTNWKVGLIGFVILIVGIVFAYKYFKANNNGFMKYSQGLGIGTLAGLVAGILTAIVSYFYIEFIDPSVLENMKQAQIEMMEGFNLPEEQMDKFIEDLENKTTALRQAINQIIGLPIIAFILSLIIAAIMKRSQPEFE